jgi:hypothetical protein
LWVENSRENCSERYLPRKVLGLRSTPTTGAQSLTDYFLTSTELVAPLAHLEFNFRIAASTSISANRSPKPTSRHKSRLGE